MGALIFAYRHLQHRFSKRTDVSDPVPGFSSGLQYEKQCVQIRPFTDTFQLAAILPCSAFLASRKINKLRVFNKPEYSDSPRLHHLKVSVINRLQLGVSAFQIRSNCVAVLEAGELE